MDLAAGGGAGLMEERHTSNFHISNNGRFSREVDPDSAYLIAGCTVPLPLLPLPLVGVVALGPWALPGLWGRDPTIRPVFGSIRNLLRIKRENYGMCLFQI